ncbi:MAG: FAD-dependent oxidoreductase [Longimicrobiales bacterium]
MSNSEFDVVIVGSGPGGAMTARQLARAGQRVLILEGGRDWRSSRLYGTYAGPLLYAERRAFLFTREGMNIVRPQMVGGATSMFAGCSSPPRSWWRDEYDIDLDADAAAIHDELGIAPLPSTLRGAGSTAIAEAGTDLGMAWHAQDKFMWPQRVRAFDCGAHCLLGCRCGAKWNAGELVTEAVAAGATLWTRAHVSKVLSTHGRAAGVTGKHAGRTFTIECDNVVLSAGGLGTPAIMRASGFADAGRGIAMDTTVMVYGRSFDLGMGNDPPMTWSAVDDELGVMYSTLLDPWLMYPLILARQGFARPMTWGRWAHTLGVMIKLTDDVSGGLDDRGGISKGLTIADKRKLDRAVEVATAILHRTGCKGDSIFTTPLRGTHPCATVRIGELLDTNLATSLPGLHVCDASVFPRALGRPTVLTILALARRLARRLTE